MLTEIYVGKPPLHIENWIKNDKLTGPLCFTAKEAGSTVMMKKSDSSAPTVYLETSTTGKNGSWSNFTVDSTTITLPNAGDKVYFRAKQDNQQIGNGIGYNYFRMTGKIAASGNLNTLLKANGSVLDLTGRDWCFNRLFSECESLVQAPVLPATTLTSYCYNRMFNACTSLTQAPALPAMTLANDCYAYMFEGCSSLVKAPELPATTLAEYCYFSMFQNCISLSPDLHNQIVLPATTTANYCYASMFNGCSSMDYGPEIDAKYTNNGIDFELMFFGTSTLTRLTLPYMTADEVTEIANYASIGIPDGNMVIIFSSDGVVVIGNDENSSGS